MPWIELDELRALLGLEADDPSDETLALALAGAEAQFIRLTGDPVAATDRDVALDSSGGETLYLPHGPIIGDVTLTRTAYGSDPVEVDADTFVPDSTGAPMLHKRIRGLRWARGRAAYRAVYRSGYEEIPSDVVSAVAEMVSLGLRGAEAAGLSSETIGAYSWRSAMGEDALSHTVRETIQRWQRIPLPPIHV